MFNKPAVVFPDVEEWAVTYLTDALGDVDEDYATADVANLAPDTLPVRLVTVRDDGGPRSAHVTKDCSLAVNVWADDEAEASALVRLVVALLEQAPGGAPIVAHVGTSGPVRVPEPSIKPHWFATVDLSVRGASL